MTTITRDISWSGSWSKLYKDPTDPNTKTIYGDSESSSIKTSIDDGDTIILSQEAQQATDFDSQNTSGGLDAISAIYSAAASIINSNITSDQDKIVAYATTFALSSLSNTQTDSPADNDVSMSSYGAKFEKLEDNFSGAIANSAFMKTAMEAFQYGNNLPDNAPSLQKEIHKAVYSALDTVMYGVNGISINLQESITQNSSGETTTSYSLSYTQNKQIQPDTELENGDSSTIDDPITSNDTTSEKKKTLPTFKDQLAKLEQEIVNELFGHSKEQDKLTDTNNQTSQKTEQTSAV